MRKTECGIDVAVRVGVEPTEGFDAVARALGYVKARACRMGREGGRPGREVVAWTCSECGEPTYSEGGPSLCAWCGASVVTR